MTASLDGTIRIWSTTNGTELMQNFQSTPVADAVLSADGELIATCDTGTPGTAYLWDGRTGAMMRFFTDNFHHVNFAGRCPATVFVIQGQHPKRRPHTLAPWHLGAELEFAIEF